MTQQKETTFVYEWVGCDVKTVMKYVSMITLLCD